MLKKIIGVLPVCINTYDYLNGVLTDLMDEMRDLLFCKYYKTMDGFDLKFMMDSNLYNILGKPDKIFGCKVVTYADPCIPPYYHYIKLEAVEKDNLTVNYIKREHSSFYGVNHPINTHIHFENEKNMKIKNVIFNNPATIVMWEDGTKTIVKCGEGDAYDPEKGLAMAIVKKALGTNKSQSNYCNILKKWLPKED